MSQTRPPSKVHMAKPRQSLGRSLFRCKMRAVITIAKVENLTEREWDLNLDVNTKGVFLCCQEAIKRFRANHIKGRLVNTAIGAGSARFHFHASLRGFEVWGDRPDAKPRQGIGEGGNDS